MAQRSRNRRLSRPRASTALARFFLSTHQGSGYPRRLSAGRLPSDRGPNADRPFDEPGDEHRTPRRRCHVDDVEYHGGFQGVRGGAREAVAMVTRRRISTK